MEKKYKVTKQDTEFLRSLSDKELLKFGVSFAFVMQERKL